MPCTYLPPLDRSRIEAGIKEYFRIHNKIPSKSSGVIPDPICGDPANTTFSALYHAIYRGRRGCDKWGHGSRGDGWINFISSVLDIDPTAKRRHSEACRATIARKRELSGAPR